MTSSHFITPEWPVHARVRAAFTTRLGGVSVAPYHSLNTAMHVGDDAAAVEENRRRVRNGLMLPSEPRWLDQVHGVDVITVEDTNSVTPPRADASVTAVANNVCVVQVADCMPVLLASRDGSVVAAAHAGWRGLADGVLEAAMRQMAVRAGEIQAWLGPTISQAHFEVGDEVRATFVAHDPNASTAFEQNQRGRWQCDLYALARQRLQASGATSIYGGSWCTYGEPERFFSYRRDGRCGRMAALIWLDGRT